MITARMAPTWMIAVNAVTPGSSTFSPRSPFAMVRWPVLDTGRELGDAFEDAKRQGFDQIHGHPWDLERKQQPSQPGVARM
jgi:hypothetical protein